jgi:hypothetical protein
MSTIAGIALRKTFVTFTGRCVKNVSLDRLDSGELPEVKYMSMKWLFKKSCCLRGVTV